MVNNTLKRFLNLPYRKVKYMKSLKFSMLISSLCLTGLISCSTYSYPVRATQKSFLITVCNGPVISTENINSSKTGKATSQGVLNLVAWGDSSIQTAISNAGCKKIHHIDYEHFNFYLPYLNINIYEEYTTVVYGE